MDNPSKNASTNRPGTFPGQSVTIKRRMTPQEFNEQFVRRVRQIREALGWKPALMAERMGVPLENWRKYENRTPLPHHLIPKFCRITGAEVWFLLTGETAGKVAHATASPRPQVHRAAK
jgi:ribosome-binding protein aMBF1 (putative translation factor)